jgi:oxygen-independent coproporphyrinogen-3 oxidase
MSLATPPLTLYVHLPWCVRKCPYCDFNSHAVPGQGFPEQAYLSVLLEDLLFEAERHGGRPLRSIFFGGGTPSLFSGDSIGRIVAAARRGFGAVADLEVTLEANPGTIERGRFKDYRAAGVNRVSLGAQSFDDRHLQALGRIHAADDTVRAVEELQAAGLADFNLDLMYALPRQTPTESLADLERAIALGPTHLSHYQLTLEPDTGFARNPPPLPDEDAAWQMQLEGQERLAVAGYVQYEVSAYAQAGRRCRHNLNYWRYGDYVGIGAGAHGKRSDAASGQIWRSERLRHPARYLERAAPSQRIAVESVVRPEERAFEYCLNALRLDEGFSAATFEAATGVSAQALSRGVADAVARGLLVGDGAGRPWRPTELGHRFLNELQALFLPERTGRALNASQRLAAPQKIG